MAIEGGISEEVGVLGEHPQYPPGVEITERLKTSDPTARRGISVQRLVRR